MNNRIKNIKVILTSDEFVNDQFSVSDDAVLFDNIGDYMTGSLDIEDIKNDPSLAATKEVVNGMIIDYNKKISGNRDNEKFIKDIFSGNSSGDNISDEIRTIKEEIADKNLDLVTSEWVREWHAKKQTGKTDAKTQEITNFISDAIKSVDAEHTEPSNDSLKKRSERSVFARYVSLSAAAMIGVFLLIKTLLPTTDPEKLFHSFYKPFEAVSPVTRSINKSEPDRYSSAIISYKNGNYKGAIAGFESVLEKDPLSESARFLLGMSQLALQNYSRTIDLLAVVANGQGEYGKEAEWYLGLSYLKTGNKTKAIECFEYLVKSNGFYRERAENILSRLK